MGKIRNLHTLELEMEKMELRLKNIELQLDQNLSNLRENAGSMAFNSIIGQEGKEKLHHFWSRMAEKLMDNPRLQHNIGKWVDKLADKLADGIEPPVDDGRREEVGVRREA
ncbi:MAG TPA: hypothetical protein VFX73_05620, partial [Chitinophagaceae bacterium]|nr:hypothetical protein [Chitinophagaceae bacterium]